MVWMNLSWWRKAISSIRAEVAAAKLRRFEELLGKNQIMNHGKPAQTCARKKTQKKALRTIWEFPISCLQ